MVDADELLEKPLAAAPVGAEVARDPCPKSNELLGGHRLFRNRVVHRIAGEQILDVPDRFVAGLQGNRLCPDDGLTALAGLIVDSSPAFSASMCG